MKVTKVQNVPVHTDGGGVSLFVRIETDAGIHGLGEVGTSKTGRAIMEAVDHLAEVVVGSDPWETERLWQLMFRGNFFPAGPCLRVRHQRHRHCALGYKGKIRRFARLQASRRTRAREGRLLSSHPRRNHR